MRYLPLVAILALTACGGKSDDNASTSASADGTSVAAGAAVDCKDLPPYAPLVGDAVVSVCSRGVTRPGHVAGSVIYASAMAPDAVIAFYKDKAEAAGLRPGMSAPGAYSAVDGAKRSVMVMPKANPDGTTHVILNWGRDE